MRKYIYFVLLFISVLFLKTNQVSADEIAKCVYKGDGDNEIILTIGLDYTISAEGTLLTPPTQVTGFNWNYVKKVTINYADFIDSNSKFSCNSVPKIYFNEDTDVDNRNGTKLHYIELKDITNVSGQAKLSHKSTEYMLDIGSSQVNYENYDEKTNEQKGWLYTCHYGDQYISFNKNEYESNISFRDSSVMDTIMKNEYSCPFYLCSEFVGAKGAYVTRYYFSEKYKNKLCVPSNNYTSEYTCGALQMHMDNYNEIQQKIESGENTPANITERNTIKSSIQLFCSTALQNLGYEDSNNCVKECLKISSIISDISYDTGECGFSGRLLAWINNILKWIKYILPVIVIIFSIVDFIKAIAADKDDEMKKAQKHFIIRLVAAALAFIIPFIIEFILDKMGFTANSCGIDLFK